VFIYNAENEHIFIIGEYMRNIIVFAVILIFPGILFAQIPIPSKNPQLQRMYILESKNWMSYKMFVSGKNHFTGDPAYQDETPGKSPLKAAILSGLIPGAGQWYAGSKIKALAFFAVEVSFWVGHYHYKGLGEDKEKEFRTYADDYWSKEDYLIWKEALTEWNYSHTLPDTKTQQYYEMIGKYDQFLAGWPDSDGFPEPSTMRLYYMDMQHDSNKKFDRASRFAQLMILNRVLSAAEAAYSVKRKSSNFSAHVRWTLSPSEHRLMPVAFLRYFW